MSRGVENGLLQGSLKTLNRSPRPIWFIEIGLGEFHLEGLNPHCDDKFELLWRHVHEVRMAEKERARGTPDDMKNWSVHMRSRINELHYLFIPK